MIGLSWSRVVAILVMAWLTRGIAAQTSGEAAPPVRTKLPQDHDYQRVLTRYMRTLTEKDFTHAVTQPLPSKPTASDPEYLHRQYLLTKMNQPLVGTKRGVPAVNAPASLFLLSSIETPRGVLKPPVWPETLIPLVHWDYPGNLYRDNRALKLRAFVTAAILLMMFDADFEANPTAGRADLYAYQLVYFGLPYAGFRDVLPPEVRRAYEAGLRRMGQRVLDWGVRWEDPQSDLIAPFGLWCVARVIDDPAFARAVEAFARKLYTDPRYFNPAGYWTFRGGIDIPFNGQGNFFAATTGLATGWPFVKEALDRTYRLRAHLILPEPDGKRSGPSHFNSRVSGPASIDQWAWGIARDSAAAMLTDEAAHLIPLPSAEELRTAPATQASHFNFQIAENPIKTGDGSAARPYVNLKNDEITSHPWQRRVWMTYNFPASVNPGYEFYRPGAFAHRQELQKKNSPLLKSPFERGETFIRAFEKDFVVCRQPGFAAILHTGPIGNQDAAEKLHQFTGPMGLSGGQLSAFWTPATGSVLLGQRGGMTRNKSFDVVEAWRTWPNHSVSGVTADGVFFTSARIQKPDTTIDITGNTARVTVAGKIPSAIVGQDRAIRGAYHLARTFQLDEKGVSVETTIRGDGQEKVAELYEVLPLYLRDAREQAAAKPTLIEFQVAGKWGPAQDRFVSAVQAVRLTRFDGAVLITLDRPRRVKLSPSEWSDTYLSRGTARNVLVDLMEADDVPTALKGMKKISYRLTPVVK